MFIVLVNNNSISAMAIYIPSLSLSIPQPQTSSSLTLPFPSVFYKLSSTYDERQAARPRLQAS